MDFQGRAFYNLLRFNSLEDPAARHYEKWQIEDYRSLTDDAIFARLNSLSLFLDLESFQEIAKNFDTPEALSEYLTPDEFEAEICDKIYLCFFELWRRYRKDCRSISIFCDELDLWMEVYDGQKEDIDDIINSYLFELENLLDEEVDRGRDPKLVFSSITPYLAHDIENFIYDFVYDLIEKDSTLIASELIDAFLPYVQRSAWFEFLRLKVFSKMDIDQFPSLVHRFSEKVIELKDIELLIEVLDLLIDVSLVDLFLNLYRSGLKFVSNYTIAQEFLVILKEFYDSIEDHKKSNQVQLISMAHSKKDPDKKLSKEDPLLVEIKQLID